MEGDLISDALRNNFLSCTSFLWWFHLKERDYNWEKESRMEKRYLCTVGQLTSLYSSCAGTGKQETNSLLHYSTSSFHLFFHPPPHFLTRSAIQPLPMKFSPFHLSPYCELDFHLSLVALIFFDCTYLFLTLCLPLSVCLKPSYVSIWTDLDRKK